MRLGAVDSGGRWNDGYLDKKQKGAPNELGRLLFSGCSVTKKT